MHHRGSALCAVSLIACSSPALREAAPPGKPKPEAVPDRAGSVGNFHVQKCTSGVDYPTKGDESVSVDYGAHTYHLRILHPKVVAGPHFSIPFFWVSERGKEAEFRFRSLISVQPHIGGLSWDSINRGYFFAERRGTGSSRLSGFFAAHGYDNLDWGHSGWLFLFDGEKSFARRWSYARESAQSKGEFRIGTASGPGEPSSSSLLTRLADVLNHAEEEADGWPGLE